jgi:polysaccharide pyruvyl transferase WcaK-like protein
MIYLFFSGGSGNRGCEAIVRGTKEVLNNNNLILYTANTDEDIESGLSRIIECRRLTETRTGLKEKASHLLCGLSYYLGNGRLQVRQLYTSFFQSIKKGDCYLVIGGDVYCYDKPRIYYRVNEILKHNKKILWGCSIEPDNIDDEMKKDLQRYDKIYARESITYDGLIAHGIKGNIQLYPDPAFAMKIEECDLPKGFKIGNTIGINVSPLIAERETMKGITLLNYKKLIQYILDITDCQIALIPHVIWKNSDDRAVLEKLYDEFQRTGRVILVEALPAEQIKGIISKCRFMVAARTHASIAAYSTCVPTLVVGYSVKARGIAKDLFGDIEHYTISVQSLKNENDLTKAFQWIWEREDEVRKHLQEFIPSYIEKLKGIPEMVRELEKG